MAFVAVFLCGICPQWLAAQAPDVYFEALSGWSYRWGDSPVDENNDFRWLQGVERADWQSASTLLSPAGDSQDFLWLRTTLPDSIPKNALLGTRYIWLSYEVYIGAEKVASYGVMGPDRDNKYNGHKLQLLRIPGDAHGRELLFRVYSPYPSVIGIPHEVYLSSEYNLARFALRHDIATLIIGLILSVAGLLLLIVRAHGRSKDILLIYLGLFAFSYGINYVAGHPGVYLLLESPRLPYYGASLFSLFPVGLLGLFEQMIGTGYKGVIRKLLYAHLMLWFVVLSLDVLNVVPYYLLGPYFFGLLAISLIAMIITVVPAILRGNPEAKIFSIGLLIAGIPGLVDTVLQGLLTQYDIPSLSPWGVIGFMIVLGLLLDRRFSENTRQLQIAHAQLEEYNVTLEQRVASRTHELSIKNELLTSTLNDLRAAQDQLVQTEKMASLGQLTAGIAHEIKNPLNFINNFAVLSIELADELHRSMPTNGGSNLILADLKENAARIVKHGRRADQIVQSMMQHASGHTGQRESTDLNQLVEDYINLAYHGMRARRPDFTVHIDKKLDERLRTVTVIRQEVGRVLINLFNNAFDALQEKAKTATDAYVPALFVSTSAGPDVSVVRVSDNGTGIPPDARDKLFDPFFTTKPAGSGTGLGLSLSFDIVVNGHGGQLSAENNEYGGATFTIELPVNDSETSQS